MTAYLIAKINVTDMEQYKKYMAVSPDLIKKFGGRFIARGGEMVTLEGPEETQRVVLIEFPSLERVKAFYNSAGYQEAKKLRQGAASAQFIVIEGV